MNYLILQFISMFCLNTRRITGHTVTKTNSHDIDEFINQLMSSQKFEELAERLAEKAADKIKYLASEIIPQKTPVAQNSDDNGGEIEIRHKNDNIVDTKHVESTEETYKKRHINIERQRASVGNKNSNKPGRIDTQALMKNDEDTGHDELPLKYKHFVKNDDESIHEHKHIKEHNDRNRHTESKPKAKHPEIEKEHEKDEENVQADPDYGLNVENSKRNQIIQHKQNGHPKFVNKDPDVVKRFRSDNNISEPVDTDAYTQHLSRIVVKKDTKSNHDAENYEKVRDSEEQATAWQIRNQESAQTDEQQLDEQQYQAEEVTETIPKLVRREGDRYYAYLSAPEYADFYEKMAKEESRKRNDYEMRS